SLMLSLSFTHPSCSHLYTLSLHDALPISPAREPRRWLDLPARRADRTICLRGWMHGARRRGGGLECASCDLEPSRHSRGRPRLRSEEHTSELQSRGHLVCRLLLEKKKKKK